jgi:hypothetical protein
MLTTINPRLRRSDVVLDSFHSRISNTPKEFSWTPEMSFSKVLPQPRMLFQKPKSRSAFKQLKSSTNAYSSRQFNKQMDVVNSNVKFINFTTIFDCHFSDESFTIHPNTIKLQSVFGILRFPDKMESILSEGMTPTLQIHFFTPQTFIRNKVLSMFVNLIQEGINYPFLNNNSQELNFTTEHGSPPTALKQWYPSLFM